MPKNYDYTFYCEVKILKGDEELSSFYTATGWNKDYDVMKDDESLRKLLESEMNNAGGKLMYDLNQKMVIDKFFENFRQKKYLAQAVKAFDSLSDEDKNKYNAVKLEHDDGTITYAILDRGEDGEES